MDLTDKVVLVTGAGQGIGREIALKCAAAGARIIVNDFHEARAASVAAEIGDAALSIAADVTDYEAVGAMFERSRQWALSVDVVVNNAGNGGSSNDPLFTGPRFWESSPESWDRWMDVNLFGVLNVTRHALPDMVTNKNGRIVSVISDAGRVGEASLVVYGAAKAGVAGFTRGLAKAVGRYGINANCISLSSMNTESVSEVTANAEAVQKLLEGYPIRRLGEPTDAANMVLFLASDAASWITGQTYPVNGGYSFAL